MSLSKINTKIDLDFLKQKENLYYDRKSAKIDYSKIADEIMSFANAQGGVLVLGVKDDGYIEGVKKYGVDKINRIQKVVNDYLRPSPIYNCEIIDIINDKGEDDNLIIFHIEPSLNRIIRNTKDEVTCRMGDSSIKLTHDQIRNLEYDRNETSFENNIVVESTLDDIDYDVVKLFKDRLETDEDEIAILKARGYLREYKSEYKFTVAGLLLFGKDPSKYYPCSRIRVIKFEGDDFQTGKDLNIIKEKSFEKNIYKNLIEARDFINSQLREFIRLNEDGLFEKKSEYPEFAWYEGLVNAVTHRDYSNLGEQIIVKIYNNRIEISSPGKLGGFVTLENMKVKRYSRNPQIARTLVEFGIVRELNEGVKRIYNDMEKFGLDAPEYSEPDRNSVLLILKNNIEKEKEFDQKRIENLEKIKKVFDDLNPLERKVVSYIMLKNGASREEIEKVIDRKRTATISILNNLIEKNVIEWNGSSKNDSYGKYEIK